MEIGTDGSAGPNGGIDGNEKREVSKIKLKGNENQTRSKGKWGVKSIGFVGN